MSFTCSLVVDHSPVTKLHLTWRYEIGIIEWQDDMQAIFQAAGVLFVLAPRCHLPEQVPGYLPVVASRNVNYFG
jgi:hypothetical protein